MKRVLITGCSGEIGRALVAALLRDPAVELVTGIDIRSSAQASARLHFTHCNVTQPCTSILREYAIDTVIHLAYTVEPTRNYHHAQDTASTGTRVVVESAKTAGVRRFLHLSSATVYGARPQNAALLSEEVPVNPNGGFGYAQHKALAEEVLHQSAGSTAFRSLIVLRPCFVIGPGTRSALVRHLCRPLVLLPRTQAPLQLVHREDLVRIILELLRHEVSGTFNVGAHGGLTASEMARRLHRQPVVLPDRLLNVLDDLAWRTRLPLAPAPAATLDLLRYHWAVDTSALQRVLPHAFRYTTDDAFQSFAEAFLLSRRRS